MVRSLPYFLFLLLLNINLLGAQTKSVARRWNEAMLEAIREDLARPPVQARNLFHVSMAMWDAWAAYDTTGEAQTFLLGKTVGTFNCQFNGVATPTDIRAAREKAISHAAYRLLARRYQNSPNAAASLMRFRNLMTELGYDWNFSSNFYETNDPAALGNYIADCITFFGLSDGANESANYNYTNYSPVNVQLNPFNPGNPTMADPNRWQPLVLQGAIDQNGNPIPALQRFQSPEWGRVVPFALADSQKTVYQRNGVDWNVYHDPGPPPFLDTVDGGGTSEEYKWNHSMTAIWSSHLDPNDGTMWDISPGGIGNTPWIPTNFEEYKTFYQINGQVPSLGRPLNPKTGQPYTPQIVPRGDYTRVLAQFWADGPNSETPPGHWFSIFNKAMDHPQFLRRFNGVGPLLDTLEYDTKAYLTLGGALHDAAITAWGIKGWYDSARPVSALRWMADQGQSSDPSAPRYDLAGIQLVPGYIEQVQAGDPLAGSMGQNLGKIKLYTWLAFDSIANPATDIAGAGWILAGNWWPFQRKTFVTPPFAGYISGHSIYSRSAAEALTLLTGDEYFPGGMAEYHVSANSGFLGVEKGPSVDVTLQWATYRDASDQTSLSRIWGGIHPPADDIPGRVLGAKVGTNAFEKAKKYFFSSDFDADGYGPSVDCDDTDPDIHPGVAEICDGIDNDCDGTVDNGLSFAAYYADTDEDGYGDFATEIMACTPPAGFVTNSFDCYDSDPNVYPGALEVCDGLDNDCNGLFDEGLEILTYYEDADGDGFGNGNSSVPTCLATPPEGFVTNFLDCDDHDPLRNPNVAEICDGLDNNCDGLADNNLTINTFYTDADGDNFGDNATAYDSCLAVAPVGQTLFGGDCDDTDPDVHPGALEICDGLDNNCNGLPDDGLAFSTYYQDADGDGFGTVAATDTNCLGAAPAGFVANNLDCDDSDPDISPDAPELIDGLDNDCNGLTDDVSAVSALTLQVKTFPNPVREVLTILLEKMSGAYPIQVSSAEGKVLINNTLYFSDGQANLDFAHFPPGVYLLRVSDTAGKKYWVQRVVKM